MCLTDHPRCLRANVRMLRGVAFESESDLRQKGAYKTPDMLLQIPMAIKGPRNEVSVISGGVVLHMAKEVRRPKASDVASVGDSSTRYIVDFVSFVARSW